MKLRLLALTATAVAAVALTAACTGPKVTDHTGQKPELDLREYFDGTLDGWGFITDRWGNVKARFTVVMRGRWDGDQGVLDEEFTYASGDTQKRSWQLERLPDGRYVGTAKDVIGKAEGLARGNVFAWKYTLAFPIDGKTWHIDFDDWLFRMDERAVLNKATLSKWGIKVGEMTASFVKR
ncbi:MAG: DUF3833 domain-containing protein [Burkholderiales bacterium]